MKSTCKSNRISSRKLVAPRLIALLGAAIIIGGCSTIQPPAEQAENKPKVSQEDSLRELVRRDPLFAIMAAELASQRGDSATAVAAYLAAAQESKDAELARRAVELALTNQDNELALTAAREWFQLAPNDAQAKRTVLLLQLSTNRVEEALPAVQAMLTALQQSEEKHPGVAAASPMKVALELLLRIPDKTLAYETGLKVLSNDPTNSETQYVLSQLAFSADNADLAATHLQNVINEVPEERYYLLLAQYFQKRDGNDEAAMSLLEEQATKHPNWFSTRLFLARVLTQQSRWSEAADRFAQLIALQPNNYPLYSSQGFVLSKLKDANEAERHFNLYLKHTDPAERNNELLIHLTMAELFNEQKNFTKAIEWLKTAPNANESVDVQLVMHKLYKEQNNTEAATRVLQTFKPQGEDDTVRLALALSKWKEEQKDFIKAVHAIDQGLLAYPDQPDLLYERAMLAERQSDLVNVEKYLKRLIEVKPDNPHGYNALGYTWADHNIRLYEALELIKKANELSPEDPFILDSLGWVHYRLGELDLALPALERAYKLRSDEEIGLHLLELYVRKGDREKALQTFNELKAKYPNSSALDAFNEKLSNI